MDLRCSGRVDACARGQRKVSQIAHTSSAQGESGSAQGKSGSAQGRSCTGVASDAAVTALCSAVFTSTVPYHTPRSACVGSARVHDSLPASPQPGLMSRIRWLSNTGAVQIRLEATSLCLHGLDVVRQLIYSLGQLTHVSCRGKTMQREVGTPRPWKNVRMDTEARAGGSLWSACESAEGKQGVVFIVRACRISRGACARHEPPPPSRNICLLASRALSCRACISIAWFLSCTWDALRKVSIRASKSDD